MCIGGCPKCECVKTDEEREYFVVAMINEIIEATSEDEAKAIMKDKIDKGEISFEITAELEDIEDIIA